MSSTAVRLRLGFAVVAALSVAGCGGGTAKNAASTGSAASSTPPVVSTSSAPALADSSFCKQLSSSMAELVPAFEGGASDPAQLGAAVKKEAALAHSIHPPAEIAADWQTLTTALDALASGYGKLKPGDPASATAFLGQNQAQLTALEGAAAHLGSYLSTNCGIAVPTDLSAAPTS